MSRPIFASMPSACSPSRCWRPTIIGRSKSPATATCGQPDAVTSRFQASADRWIDTATLSDAALAERIAADGIDILVDLTGHLEGHRLLAFARRPAPIQVTYIGYQNTTGMQAMDYRLTDDWSDPPGTTDRFYTEKLVRLPRAFFCYRPFDDAPPVNALPARATGRVTFGSFNKLAKITSRSALQLGADPGPRARIALARAGRSERRSAGTDAKCICRAGRGRRAGRVRRQAAAPRVPAIARAGRHRPGHVPLQRPYHRLRGAVDGRAGGRAWPERPTSRGSAAAHW